MHTISAKLLVIDDDAGVRASLGEHLEACGFCVLQAATEAQGWHLFEHEQPDLVLCDLGLPEHAGQMLVQRIAEHGGDEPVIALSAAGVMSDAVEALRLGAVDYLVKPLDDLALLEHSVRRALDRARLRRENRRYREKLEAANRELQASLSLLQEDQNAGRQVQMNMLPQTPWETDGLRFAHRILPSLYLSGDFVDYFQIDEQRIGFYLADVSGHGASSAFVTVLLKFMTTRLLYESRRGRSRPPPDIQPSQVLAHINRGLLNCRLGKHVTMVGGVIDLRSQTLTYSVGGHLPLPVLFCDGEVRYLQGRGLPVGLFEEARYEDHQLPLPECFSLTLCSDGVLELLPGTTLKDKEAALPRLVRESGGTLDGLQSALGLVNLGEMPDDIALLVLSRKCT